MNVLGVLKHNRSYILWSGMIFALGWVIGALFPEQLYSYVEDSLERIRDLAEKTQGRDSALYTSWVIFKNNLTAVVVMLVTGVAFGFVTMMALLMNGMLIGVMFGSIGAQTDVAVWEVIVFGLLPHGVFELAAIFIAAGFGLKLGRVLLVPLREKNRRESFGHVLGEIARTSWVIVLLLVVAAGVEGTITPVLLQTFVKM